MLNKMILQFIIGLICGAATLFQGGVCLAGAADSISAPGQMDVTIINVDQYGVYAPNLVFYWDDTMNKQKISALKATAGKLRNKKATVTYTDKVTAIKTKRRLLVDLVPTGDQVRPAQEPFSDRNGPQTSAPPKEEQPPQPATGVPTAQSPKEPSAVKHSSELSYSQARYPSEGDGGRIPATRREVGPATARQENTGRTNPFSPIAIPVPSITNDEVVGFIHAYLDANEMKDIPAVMAFYADQVDYYSKGMVDMTYIRKDKSYYFRNWDKVSYLIDGNVKIIDTDREDVKVAEFRCYFSVENVKKTIAGNTENMLKIRKVNSQLKIIEEKQRIISRDTKAYQEMQH